MTKGPWLAWAAPHAMLAQVGGRVNDRKPGCTSAPTDGGRTIPCCFPLTPSRPMMRMPRTGLARPIFATVCRALRA